ncbi:MAG: hypothetical protein JSV78_09180 [Phycisphaerales bacterium]|nr:MAG: hypothetical protein JSV78_09180 [Phycisphaerales bacterium]
MTRPKSAPALFEVLDKAQRRGGPKVKVPPWLSRKRRRPAEPPKLFDLEKPEEPAADRKAAPAPDAGAATRFFEYDGRLIRLRFTSFSAAIAIGCVILLAVAAFKVGSNTGFNRGQRSGFVAGQQAYLAEAYDEIQAARSRPPQPELIQGLQPGADVQPAGPPPATASVETGSKEPAPRDTGAAAPTWVEGNTYVVVQNFSADRGEDVLRSQAFLAQHGVETAIIQRDSGRTQLVTVQGFNRRDEAQNRLANELLERVRQVGKLYWEAGGRYKFEGYFKLRKGDTW